MHDAITTVTFTLNGSPQSIAVDPRRRLIDVLRDDLGLSGVKEGCGEGECGACSILVDGRIINSCIIPIGYVEGLSVETIEAIRETPTGHRLTDAFADHGAVQCGFCIPGMIVAGYSLLRQQTRPDEETVREAISGNLCRCTGYDRIVAAVQAAGDGRSDTAERAPERAGATPRSRRG